MFVLVSSLTVVWGMGCKEQLELCQLRTRKMVTTRHPILHQPTWEGSEDTVAAVETEQMPKGGQGDIRWGGKTGGGGQWRGV